RPLVGIFGAKAAPAYTLAKDIIHAILCLQDLLKKDPAVSPYLQVVMVENYNVTAAEHIIPACDISEQISLASKEASGTGNMKMMVNGGVTLGTEDGANVEIHQLVGDENIYVFGMNSQQVLKRYEEGDYDPHIYYQKQPALQQAVDFLTHPAMTSLGQKEKLQRLQKELLTKDWFMTFPDFQDYCHTKDRMLSHYENSLEWAKKMLVNIAKSGYFSSDRTIREYNRDIWKLEKIQRSE
ncbi:MAG: glycogen/starch/alpha-glucan phosphorylase, partial [Clostridia bacterium]|nr:glycogen/starch/alpha-glucan phosphorylase [Clostridia bacterium]